MQILPLKEKNDYNFKNKEYKRKKNLIIEVTLAQTEKQNEKQRQVPPHFADHTTAPKENDLGELPDKEFERMDYMCVQIIQKSRNTLQENKNKNKDYEQRRRQHHNGQRVKSPSQSPQIQENRNSSSQSV